MKELLIFFMKHGLIIDPLSNEELVLPLGKVMSLLPILQKYNFLILGGDLYCKEEDTFKFLYDMWSCQEKTVAGAIIETRVYLEEALKYHKQKDIFVSLVLSD